MKRRGWVAVAVLMIAAAGVFFSDRWAGSPSSDEPLPNIRVVPPLSERITVDVRNAGGRQGMARQAMEYLRGFGIDVVSIGNSAQSGVEASVVIDRVGKIDKAETVAMFMGIERVETLRDSTLLVDVSVELGRGWEIPGKNAFIIGSTDAGAPAQSRTWLDGAIDRLRELVR